MRPFLPFLLILGATSTPLPPLYSIAFQIPSPSRPPYTLIKVVLDQHHPGHGHGRTAFLRHSALQASTGTPSSSPPSKVDLETWMEEWKDKRQQDGGGLAKATIFQHTSLAEVLAEVYDQVLKAEKAEKGAPPPEHLLLFPQAERLYDGQMMRQFGDHLDLCKECCEVMGVSQNTIAMHPSTTSPALQTPVPALLIKGIANAEDEFEDDPFWDDDDEGFDFSALYANEDGETDAREQEKLYEVPEGDGPVMAGMREWVDAVIADLGVCPFTVNAGKAGLPQGAIRYEINRSMSPEEIYRKYWQEVALISTDSAQAQDERSLSTTLLITPNFGLRNREFFETFSNTLTQPLEALGLEDEVQLVFFHPEWVFRDGADRMGQDDAANFARRSPWPMINILRTPQVRKAQKAIPTGLVYRQNEVTLDKIGSGRLRRWLVTRDWGEVKDNFRVDRKTVPILSTAQDLLSGLTPEALKEEDVVLVPSPCPKAGEGAVAQEDDVLEGGQDVRLNEQTGGEDIGMDLDELEDTASASAVAYSAAAASEAAAANRQFFGGGFEDEFAALREAVRKGEEDDDDWDQPLSESLELLERGPHRARRPMGEIIEDSKAVLAMLRKRLGQRLPLSPAEVHSFEERAKRMQND